MPTMNECFGIVFSEASSFGVPSLSTKTGGVVSAVKDGINGKTFDISANAMEYVDYILYYFNNFEEYKKLALSSFNEYETRLNWNVSGQQIMKYIEEILQT